MLGPAAIILKVAHKTPGYTWNADNRVWRETQDQLTAVTYEQQYVYTTAP
jgi:hypothetical protein